MAAWRPPRLLRSGLLLGDATWVPNYVFRVKIQALAYIACSGNYLVKGIFFIKIYLKNLCLPAILQTMW
jgi:hypothetical protein